MSKRRWGGCTKPRLACDHGGVAGKSAYENYKGHGVFTYALIEPLHKGDTNGNGKVEVGELAEMWTNACPS